MVVGAVVVTTEAVLVPGPRSYINGSSIVVPTATAAAPRLFKERKKEKHLIN